MHLPSDGWRVRHGAREARCTWAPPGAHTWRWYKAMQAADAQTLKKIISSVPVSAGDWGLWFFWVHPLPEEKKPLLEPCLRSSLAHPRRTSAPRQVSVDISPQPLLGTGLQGLTRPNWLPALKRIKDNSSIDQLKTQRGVGVGGTYNKKFTLSVGRHFHSPFTATVHLISDFFVDYMQRANEGARAREG